MSFDDIKIMLVEINALSITVRLTLAMILGGIVGLERGLKKRPAGMRTYMLVSIGATLVMITNQYLAILYPGSDPARLGAQVVSGIGFLGVGTIIITRDKQVRGLTTAAGLWASACMGLAIGLGFYTGALIGMAFIILVNTVMHRLDIELVRRSRAIEVYIELADPAYIYRIMYYLKENHIRVSYMEVMRPKFENQGHGGKTALMLSLLLPMRTVHFEVLSKLNEIEYVVFAEEV